MSQQERVRYHEYMRPRFSNPTYSSSNVAGSLTLPYWQPLIHNKLTENYSYQPNSYRNQRPVQKFESQRKEIEANYNRQAELKKSYREDPRQSQNMYTEPHKQTPSEKSRQLKPTHDRRNTQPNLQAYGPPQSSRNKYNDPSRLSNLGNSSLRYVPKITEREIYEKQQSKYDIINIHPKQYNETIKKYPKYRLEDMDANYFKKIQLQNQYHQMHSMRKSGNGNIQNYNKYGQNYSNQPSPRHQYHNEHTSHQNHGQRGPYPNSNYQEQEHFRPKFLNNVDEMRGII